MLGAPPRSPDVSVHATRCQSSMSARLGGSCSTEYAKQGWQARLLLVSPRHVWLLTRRGRLPCAAHADVRSRAAAGAMPECAHKNMWQPR